MEKRIICNCCGRKICGENDMVREDYLHVEKEWGYFSKKDGTRHAFNLCEECYDRMVKEFLCPILSAEVTELV